MYNQSHLARLIPHAANEEQRTREKRATKSNTWSGCRCYQWNLQNTNKHIFHLYGTTITLLARPTDSGVAFTTLAHDSLQGCLRRPRVKGLFIAGKAFQSPYWSRRPVQHSIKSSLKQELNQRVNAYKLAAFNNERLFYPINRGQTNDQFMHVDLGTRHMAICLLWDAG